ncbi:ABC-type branched-subunit amino acid transport system substrate-binding protein [Neorhizobium sp. 2083]|uniref:ABC transporter substrate-binding protein n=1 Tax=Neorhizobium sp. 2083 TaxID=2817762 RepID=UPI002858A68C|nr:ABC transporter substrate-binding protein [Neorhizobium sp. 2083]MDR6817595.1 ABC-type branched-subunit amino acid transport system substrate-binding protein [Neorhizobium sp. 2083]
MYKRHLLVATAMTVMAFSGEVRAAETFKIGSSVGLTGYAAVIDRAWRDGLAVAADALNEKGGILGKKIEIITEDNKSQPQDAVVGYRKMISSDQVNLFDSGCVSAGNFAAAAFVMQAKLPMYLCSILPQRDNEQEWAFSFLAPPKFEIEARYRYIEEKTSIRKVGILYDPTPYALMMKGLGEQLAKDFGLEVVAQETYKPDDADMTVQLGRINAAGGGAVVKIGQGGSTVTAAKNIKQLGLDKMLLLSSNDDGSIFQQAGQVLGDRFFFVAPPVQLPKQLKPGPAKDAVDAFLKYWKPKYPDRDPANSARAWDSMMVLAKAAEIAKSTDGKALRDATQKVPSYVGAYATFNFSEKQHVGITENPFLIGKFANGELVVAE